MHTTQSTAPVNWRELCRELVSELQGYKTANPMHDYSLLDRARAALSQPEPEVVGPSDEELLELMPETMRDEFSYAAKACSDATGSQVRPGIFRVCLNTAALDYARAVLARWGRPAPAADDRGVLPMIVSETGAADEPELERIICAAISGGADYVNSKPRELMLERITPEGSTFARYVQVDADARPDVRPAPAPAGEVAKLVQPPGRAGLTWQGVIEGLRDVLNDESEDAIQRVWQRSRILDAISVMEANPCPAPVPVAVSERLPGPGDCDAEGRCWVGYPEWTYGIADTGDTDATTPEWRLERPPLKPKGSRCWWLPHHALPLPSGGGWGDGSEHRD